MARPARRSLRTDDRWVLIALLSLIAIGTGLRLAMFVAQSPGFIGISDSTFYVIAARDGIFMLAADPGNAWPAGYPLFLNIVHGFSGQLFFMVLVQHALGVTTAVLLFLTVRRVAPAVWGLLPAGIVLLAGPQIFLEHNPMTETLFGFLVAGLLYCAVRARYDQPLLWGSLAGLCAVSAACVRVMGLVYIVVLVVWLLAGRRPEVGRRALAATAAALVASLALVIYLAEMKHETGFGGPALTRSGNYSVPTRGAQPNFWNRFTNDLTRFWSSDDGHAAGQRYSTKEVIQHGYDYEGVTQIMGTPTPSSVAAIGRFYPTAVPRRDDGVLDALQSYEAHTRLEGPAFVLLLLLAAVGIPFAHGRRLAVGLLTLGLAAVTLLAPIAYVYFDARYAVPGYGTLAVAGALGAATLWERIASRWGSRLRLPGRDVEPAEAAG